MCLIAFAWNPGGQQPLLIVANRDEFYARPTAPAQWWDTHPDIWGGRDLTAGGTWLGITRHGRFAAVTNYREPGRYDPLAESRGHLVSDFLTGDTTPEVYLESVAARGARFNGFNLLAGDVAPGRQSLAYLSHRAGEREHRPSPLAPGVYGLSNAVLDTPWPKVVRTTASLATLKASGARVPAYLQLLSDTATADDGDLPSTGLSLERERLLSAPFIISADYGTRSQTVVHAWNDGRVEAAERSFDNAGQAYRLIPSALRQVRFELPKTPPR